MKLKYLNFKNFKKFINTYLFKGIFSSNSKNIFEQLSDLIYVAYKSKYPPYTYYKFNGYLKNGRNVKEIAELIPGRLYDSVREDCINDSEFALFVKNKYLFNKIITENNLLASKTFGIFDKNSGFFDENYYPISQKDFIENLNQDFVYKPVSSFAQGDGVKLVKIINDNGKKFEIDNQIIDADKFYDFLYKNTFGETLIESKIVGQVNVLNKLYPTSINTIRIDTLRRLDNDVIVGCAFLRVGRNGEKVDNWYRGGILIPVDISTGNLRNIGYDQNLNEYTEHPDTKIKFSDVKIPDFDKLIEVTKKAALAFPKVNSIGWDIAVTEQGFIFVEGNEDYGIHAVQVCDGPYTRKKDFIKAVNEYIQKNPEKGKKYEKYFNR